MPAERTCFVVSPIGAAGSGIRERADKLLKHVVTPAVSSLGYRPIRSDQISESGNITSQLIQHLLEDHLVVADLTGSNPNVYYELAIRHSTGLPFIQIIDRAEIDRMPFDIISMRTIPVDLHDLDSVDQAKAEIEKQAKAFNAGAKVDTPVSLASQMQVLNESANPLEESVAKLIDGMGEIRTMLLRIGGDPERRLPADAKDLDVDHRQLLDVIDITAKTGELPPGIVARWLRDVESNTLRAHLVVAHDLAQAFRKAQNGPTE
jgi:hypothetical protein